MRTSSLLAMLAASGSLIGCAEDRTPIITAIAVAPCAPSAELDERELIAQGTVVDFSTGAPRAGVTVDLARAWEAEAVFPGDSCSLARMTTDADGRFGPITVKVGPRPNLFDRKIVVFLVQGADVSPTASDITVGSSVDHVIEAPSLDLADVWRAELTDGGMAAARTRGLILYRYDDASGTQAAGVTAQQSYAFIPNRTMTPGREVRYLEPDRQTITADSWATTTASGLALIGADAGDDGSVEIAGARASDRWYGVGALSGEGWLFVEASRASAP